MNFYLDEENSKGNYCYATFEEAFGGNPLFVYKRGFYLIVPVINQGIYDLPSFNNGNEAPLYIDKSYYYFGSISGFTEFISIRENKTIRGELENTFKSKNENIPDNHHHVDLEMGYNGRYYYAATWNVMSKEFGVLIPNDAKTTENDKVFFKNQDTLDLRDLDFLLNRNQDELEQFLFSLH